MFRKSAQILLTTGTNFARRLGSRGSQRSLVTGTITTNNHETRYKIFSKQRYAVYQTSTLTRLNIRSHCQCHACWKCGQELAVTSGAEDLCPARRFFCPGEDCGVLQPVKNFNYFEVFNLPPKYDLDTKQLSQMFRQIQHRLHPDRSSGVPEEERGHFEDQSTHVNRAYQTLLKPVPRAQYLLLLHGETLEENDIQLESDFLMEVMDISEEIAETSDIDTLSSIFNNNRKKMDNTIQLISQAFSNHKIKEAKQLIAKIKYLVNIEDKIKEKTYLH